MSLLTPLVSRLLRTAPVTWFTSRYMDPIDRFLRRASGGRLSMARLFYPELVLFSLGARSGVWRENTLLHVRDDDARYIVGTNFGGDSHPGWTANLLANPEARAVVDGVERDVTAERLTPDEMAALWPRFDAVYPGYADYRARIGDSREIRMFRLTDRQARG